MSTSFNVVTERVFNTLVVDGELKVPVASNVVGTTGSPGSLVYDTTTQKIYVYTSTGVEEIISAGGGGGGGGGILAASNVGTGVGVFDSISGGGTVLNFKSILGTAALTATIVGSNVVLTIVPGSIDINSLMNAPAGGVVGASEAQALTNKTINGITGGNTISINASSITDGTIPVGRGGTGATTLVSGDILIGNGGGVIASITPPGGDLVGTTETQTLSGKTLSAPNIAGGSITADLSVVANVDITFASGGTGQLDMGTNKIVNLGTPTNNGDAVSKLYVDGIVATGLDAKESVQMATVADLGATYATTPNNGQFTGVADTIDGVTLALPLGQRVLVKDQTDPVENGIYTVTVLSSGNNTLTRSADMDGTPAAEVSGGNYCFIDDDPSATVNGGDGYVVLGAGDLALNTAPIVWGVFSVTGVNGAGDGLIRENGSLSVATRSTSILNAAPGELQLASSGNAGVPIISTTTGDEPIFGALDLSNTSAVTGTTSVVNGGTGLATIGDNELLVGTAVANTIAATALFTGVTVPTIVGETATQTLTNKVLTSPTINTPVIANATSMSVNNVQITGLADPIAASDAATRSFVETVAAAPKVVARTISRKLPVATATTGNLPNYITGVITGVPDIIDGITLTANMRVLVKDQTSAIENGIYFVSTVSAGNNTITRSTDMDGTPFNEVATGNYCEVVGGTVNAGLAYIVSSGTEILDIDNDNIEWTLVTDGISIDIREGSIINAYNSAELQLRSFGIPGRPLLATTSESEPEFGALDLANANVTTGTLSVASGGTGRTSVTNGRLLVGNNTGALTEAALSGGVTVPTIVGTTAAQTLSSKILIDPTNTIRASELGTTGASVLISGAGPPVLGQILQALGPTTAGWANPAAAAGGIFNHVVGGVQSFDIDVPDPANMAHNQSFTIYGSAKGHPGYRFYFNKTGVITPDLTAPEITVEIDTTNGVVTTIGDLADEMGLAFNIGPADNSFTFTIDRTNLPTFATITVTNVDEGLRPTLQNFDTGTFVVGTANLVLGVDSEIRLDVSGVPDGFETFTYPAQSTAITAGSSMRYNPIDSTFRVGVVDGTQWQTRGYSSIAMGVNNAASGGYATLIGGRDNSISGTNGLMLGSRFSAITGNNDVVIGYNKTGGLYTFSGSDNVVIGSPSVIDVSGTNTIAASNSIFIGKIGLAGTGGSCVCIGDGASSSSNFGIILGTNAVGSAVDCIAVGRGAIGTGADSISLGRASSSSSTSSVAIGTSSTSSAANSVAIGNGATAAGADSVAIGGPTTAANVLDGIAIGKNAVSNGSASIAIGLNSVANANICYAIGGGSNASGDGCFSLGLGSFSSGTSSFAFGTNASASGSFSKYVFGFGGTSADPVNNSYWFNDAANNWNGAFSNVSSFNVNCAGGAYFYSNAGRSSGAVLVGGSSSFGTVSDRNKKENLVLFDDRESLEKLGDIPVYWYNYIGADPVEGLDSGPMAQDFHAQFACGCTPEDNCVDRSLMLTMKEMISANMSAIRGARLRIIDLETDVETLTTTVTSQAALIADLISRVEALESA